jgi:hypothetical protein
MKWLKNIFAREPQPDHPLAVSTFDKTQGALHALRRGMWVTVRGPSAKRGILTALSPEGMARVMFVHPVTGENEIELDIPANTVRQAAYMEIPEARRCDKTTAFRLGYKVE